MITVKTNESNGTTEIKISGHANSRICSAVSALSQTLILGLQAIADTYPDEIQVVRDEETDGC